MFVVWRYHQEDDRWTYMPYPDFDSAWDEFAMLRDLSIPGQLDHMGKPVRHTINALEMIDG